MTARPIWSSGRWSCSSSSAPFLRAAGPLVVAGRPGRRAEHLQQVADRLLVAAVVGGILLSGPRKVLVSRAFLGAAGLGASCSPCPTCCGRPCTVGPSSHGPGPRGPQRGGRPPPRGTDSAGDDRPGAVPGLRGRSRRCCSRRPEWRPVRWLAPATATMVGLTLVAGSQVHLPLRPRLGDLRGRLRAGRASSPDAAQAQLRLGRRGDGGARVAGRGGRACRCYPSGCWPRPSCRR